MPVFTLDELAKRTQSELMGDPDTLICGVSDLEAATSNDISFLSNSRYLSQMHASKAGCIIVAKDIERPKNQNFLLNDNPSSAFQVLIELFQEDVPPRSGFIGIHQSAVIHPDAIIEESVTICPHAVIDSKAHIHKGCFIGSHCYIGPDVVIGDESIIHPNVVIREGCKLGKNVIIQPGAVIGSCGFGYTQDKTGQHTKLNQIGTVIIEDGVEIGANTTIDRARFKATHIAEGTKIDNLVQIAHGVCIGKHSLIIAQTGIAGSTTIGNHVILAGKVAVNGHITIGDQVVVAACSAVSKSIQEPGRYAGVPVMPLADHNKMQVQLRNVESIVQDIKEIKAQLCPKASFD